MSFKVTADRAVGLAAIKCLPVIIVRERREKKKDLWLCKQYHIR
jgi:hypothetical protein